MSTLIEHTQIIFEHLCSDIPPAVPREIREEITQASEQVKNNISLTLEELEDTMIYVGKKLWPYKQAFQEFYRIYEGTLGEVYLVRKFSLPMKKKYEKFKIEGGTFRELHSGVRINFFTPEERSLLCEALITIEEEIRAYTVQSILSGDERRYTKRVEEFEKILHDMEEKLQGLRSMADMEGEHPELAAEIRDQIRTFEHGFALLGPSVRHDAVCSAEEHFIGRKAIKKIRQRH